MAQALSSFSALAKYRENFLGAEQKEIKTSLK